MNSAIQRHLKQRRPFASLEEEVFVGLQLAADRLMEPWARYLREVAGLSPVQYNVLRILRGAGSEGLLAGEVAGRLLTRSPDVTRLLDRLENRELVRRDRDPDDRRAVRARITPSGLDLIAPLDDEARAMLRGLMAPMERARLEAFRDTLASLLDATPISP